MMFETTDETTTDTPGIDPPEPTPEQTVADTPTVTGDTETTKPKRARRKAPRTLADVAEERAAGRLVRVMSKEN